MEEQCPVEVKDFHQKTSFLNQGSFPFHLAVDTLCLRFYIFYTCLLYTSFFKGFNCSRMKYFIRDLRRGNAAQADDADSPRSSGRKCFSVSPHYSVSIVFDAEGNVWYLSLIHI